MPVARRIRTFPATPAAVWAIVGDPHHLARWWPKVQRVEGVDARGFTKVFGTKQGRPIRADFFFVDADGPRQRRWAQIVDGTPFERILVSSEEVIAVEEGAGGTSVRLEVHQKLRGMSRFGGVMVKRATGKQLDEALDALGGLL